MTKLKAEAINKVAQEIADKGEFGMVFINKIKVWFKLNERGVWEVSDAATVRQRVAEAVQERFHEVIAQQHIQSGINGEMNGEAMVRVQEALDLYKPAHLNRITTAMKKALANDGEILTRSVNSSNEIESNDEDDSNEHDDDIESQDYNS